jgi:60 kDa SS-A/Ro ribonucleoprotein
LILGTDGGTYYVGQTDLTKQNIDFLKKMIAVNERLVVDTIVDVSVNGRAYKNTPAIFALALVLTEGKDKAYAREAVNKVVRTGTHLFEFTGYLNDLAGWGRAKRKAVASWYEGKTADQLAYQAVKYRQRDGWTHRDVFRLAHPTGVNPALGAFILGKDEVRDNTPVSDLTIINGFRFMQNAKTVEDALAVLGDFDNLPWETIPTQFLKDVRVWKQLFENGQLKGQALVRNITRLARLDAFKDLSFAAKYADALTDEEMIRRTRLHPVNFLNASVVYNEGQVDKNDRWGYGRRNKDWTTSSRIKDALDEAFHISFKTVEPANKRTLLAVDVSGSMASPAMGLDLSCAQVSGAMAMTIARTEPAYEIRGFTSNGGGWRRDAELTDLGITARTQLNTAMNKVLKSNFGGTDCALPMLWAAQNKVAIDTFVVITDSETWAGNIKPTQALKQYREKMGIDARLAVLGVASTGFTIADPLDRGQMDFVGFDSNAPRVLADFSAGRL